MKEEIVREADVNSLFHLAVLPVSVDFLRKNFTVVWLNPMGGFIFSRIYNTFLSKKQTGRPLCTFVACCCALVRRHLKQQSRPLLMDIIYNIWCPSWFFLFHLCCTQVRKMRIVLWWEVILNYVRSNIMQWKILDLQSHKYLNSLPLYCII